MLRYSAGVRETPCHTILFFLLSFPPFRAALPTTHNLLRKMKLVNKLAAGFLAAAAINLASAADISLYITGSTAFRKAEYAAIANYLINVANVGNPLPNTTAKAAFLNNNGTTVLNGSNQAVFTVTGTPGNSVTIYCGQGGSSGGLRYTADPASAGASVKPDGSDTGHVWLNKGNAVAAVTYTGGQAVGGTSVTTATATPAWPT